MLKNAKRDAIELIERLSDDVSLDEIMYELYFRQQVDEGIRDVEEGRTVPHEEIVRELANWLKSAGRQEPAET